LILKEKLARSRWFEHLITPCHSWPVALIFIKFT